MGRNEKVQVLRGLAIIAVVFIHTCNGGLWQVVCRPFLNFAVGMFLFLSGYLTGIDRDDWLPLFKKRITRVIIPYIVWTILYTLPYFTPKVLCYNLLSAQAAPMLYFVFVYVQFVVFTPLIGRLAKGKAQWAGWLVAPLSVVAFKYYWLLTGRHLNDYVSLAWGLSCLGWFTYYYLGLLLGNGLVKKIMSPRTATILLILSIPLQMLEGYGWMLLGDSNCGTQLKLTSFLTTSIILVISYHYLTEESKTARSKLLILLGDCSFGIFLCHFMVLTLLRLIPFYSSIPFPFSSIIVLSISFLLVSAVRKMLGAKVCKWIGFA